MYLFCVIREIFDTRQCTEWNSSKQGVSDSCNKCAFHCVQLTHYSPSRWLRWLNGRPSVTPFSFRFHTTSNCRDYNTFALPVPRSKLFAWVDIGSWFITSNSIPMFRAGFIYQLDKLQLRTGLRTCDTRAQNGTREVFPNTQHSLLAHFLKISFARPPSPYCAQYVYIQGVSRL